MRWCNQQSEDNIDFTDVDYEVTGTAATIRINRPEVQIVVWSMRGKMKWNCSVS